MAILPNDGLDKEAIDYLIEEGFEVINQKVAQDHLANFINENNVNILLVRSATQVRKELIDACPGLKVIGRAGVGMDNIDVAYAKEKGLEVINTPGASSKSVAELVLAHMRSLARFLFDSNRNMPLEGETQFDALKKSYSKATELAGKTLGIIGLGKIGQETAKLALANGMKVIAFDPLVQSTQLLTVEFFDEQTIDFQVPAVDFESLLKESDYISLHIPKQKEYVIGEKELALMKPSAFIINAARGGTIDEMALINALNSDKIAGAGLDVFENEPTPNLAILMNPKISLSPHVGGNTVEAQERIGMELADKIIDLYANNKI